MPYEAAKAVTIGQRRFVFPGETGQVSVNPLPGMSNK